MMEKNEYTITIFSENKVGILSRIVSVFTRRHINIESIGASVSSIKDIYKYTIVVIVDEVLVKKLVAQLDKQVDVIKSFHYDNSQIVQQEMALYKISPANFMGGDKMEKLVRKHNARILSIEKEYIVVEKTGLKSEIEALLKDLKKHGKI